MFLDPLILKLLICGNLVMLGLMITIDLALYSLRNPKVTDLDREIFLDESGDHTYYERAIISKKSYLKAHPNVSARSLRTLSSLFNRKN